MFDQKEDRAGAQPGQGTARPRLRDLGIVVGDLPTGEHNAITDVSGVRVGHATLISGEGPQRPGLGPVRTGVTVILPHGDNLFLEKVRAACFTINGFGKSCGLEQVRELGSIESPIALTNTLNVPLVADALVQYSISTTEELSRGHASVNVVVGETNDCFLNDIQGRHVRAEHVFAAIEAATTGPVQEGSVGAGTGTFCYGWKGGIGTASRVIPEEAGGFTVGALVQSNFGWPSLLTICSVPVGRHIPPPGREKKPQDGAGSIMTILATDAPLTSRQLRRLCVRVAAGLAHTGSHLHHFSGDFAIAFSTAERIRHASKSPTKVQTVLDDEGAVMSHLFPAVSESVEEAVLNSLCRAVTVVGRDGNTLHALPVEEVVALVRKYRPGA
jgi:D-aminopeptidase